MIDDFHFIRPYWLFSFIPYVLVMLMVVRNHLRQGNWASICDPELLPYLLQTTANRRNRSSLVIAFLSAFLAILALAGPSWERLPAPAFRNESALVIALNLSITMDAEDIKPSRLIRARYKIADILRLRKDGLTALLVYAGDAFTVTPLTNDNDTIASQLEALTTGIMPSPGRNTGSVLNHAVELFKQASMPKGKILLITDAVDLDQAMPVASNLGNYTLSVLGVGTKEGAPIALSSGGFLKNESGSIVVPKLKPTKLAQLAAAGNGVYRTISTNDSDIQSLVLQERLPDKWRQQKQNEDFRFDLWQDRGPLLLLAVLPMAAWFFRRGLLSLALVFLLPFPDVSHAFDWQDLWLTKDQQAMHAYQNQQYDQAAVLFENPDWKYAAQFKADMTADNDLRSPITGTGYYNQGNVLAKSGRLEEAIAAYDKALELDPQNDDAEYNKDIVEKALQKQRHEQQQKHDDQNRDQNDGQNQSGGNSEQQQRNEHTQEHGPNSDKSEKLDRSEDNESAKSESQDEKSSENQTAKNEAAAEQGDAFNQNNVDQFNNGQQDDSSELPNSDDLHPSQSLAETQAGEELQNANEQWLNRIPDDPGGLLKRKFKYQYAIRQSRK